MSELSKALTKYMAALEAVESLLEQLEQLGLQLFPPRKFRFYRSFIEPFAELAEQAELSQAAIEALRAKTDRLASPLQLVEGLKLAGVKGNAIGKLRVFEEAYDELIEAAFTDE